MSEAPVRWEVDDRGIATIRLDRPEKMNALNLEVKRLIEEAVTTLEAEDGVRVIVFTGENNVFIAGTDIAEMRDMTPDVHRQEKTDQVFHVLRGCTKPLIAAVEKYALGGGFELALCCDIIVAGESARFAQPEIRVGIMPGAGGTQILLRTIGKYKTMKMVLTGEQISARQAFDLGLISELVEAGTAYQRAMQLAETIVGMPPLAVKAIKKVISEGVDLPLTAALANERDAFIELFDSDDQVEGMQAFMDKRKPDYQGN